MTPTTTTSTNDIDRLAEQGDRIAAAQTAVRERDAHRRRLDRQRASDERRRERISPAIEALHADEQAKQAVTTKLGEELGAVTERIQSTPRPEHSDLFDFDDLTEALRQAVTDGAPLISGVSMHEGAGITPKHVRVPHPRLVELAPGLDWAHPLEAVQRHLDELTTEHAAIAKRLSALPAA